MATTEERVVTTELDGASAPSGADEERADATPATPSDAFAEVEQAVAELLDAYRDALKFAANMPLVGRCKVLGGWRWGSRFYTQVYLEVHVRKQLQAIRSCLTVEQVGNVSADERARLTKLDEALAARVGPLLQWRRFVGLLARLPPVAAALPILSALSLGPLDGDVSAETAGDAAVWLGGTVLLLWLLVVWPSIRLGFRVKRAILTGGRDSRHPLLNEPGNVRWRGFAEEKVYADPDKLWLELVRVARGRKKTRRRPMPRTNVYELEDRVFKLLGRRKPTEVPIDLAFALSPYLLFLASALAVYALVAIVLSGFEGIDSFGAFGMIIAAFVPLLFVQLLLQATRNYHGRPH